MNLLKAALEYKKLGISVIATDGNKRSIMQWKKYQQNIATDEELKAMFANTRTAGIATICGAVSGNMEVIDIDSKYDITGTLYEDYMQGIVDADIELAQKLVVIKTIGGGYHIPYRCSFIDGNKKLSQRFTTDTERKDNPHEKVKVLIETRGEAGYVIAAPTEGYTFLRSNIRDLPTITPAERTLLFDVARSFNTVIEEVHNYGHVDNKSFNKSPFQDYNERGDVVGLLQKHGWTFVCERGGKVTMLRPGDTKSKSSGDYNKTLGLFSVFTTSTNFEANKGYKPAAVYALLECNNDWKAAGKKLLAEGYGEPYKRIAKDVRKYVERLQSDGTSGDRLITKVASTFDLQIDETKSIIEKIENEAALNDGAFWNYDAKKEKLTLGYKRFAEFLMDNGFGLYFYDPSCSIFNIVHNDYNRLEEASNERIKKFTENYIDNYDLDGIEYSKESLIETIYRNNNLFSQNLYEYLRPSKIDFLRDTKDICYLPFKNGIVEIKANEVKLLKHGEVNKVIWKTDLIDFDVDIASSDDTDCEFLDFIIKITADDTERLNSAISIIGYLLHKYKHPAMTFAIILAEETDDETKGGGTGKGIFVKALEKILSSVTIDGKNFKADKSFAYQRVKLDTKLVAIQDVDKLFDFEKFYSIITEGWTIEKKNKDELYITYQDSPKVLLTTNYTINDTGNHAKRRQRVIEFSDYFGAGRSPIDVYGHLLFDDWDKDEWNRFYNFIFFCISYYLEHGVKDVTQGNKYKAKKIKVQFGEDFLNWFIEYSENGCQTSKRFNDLYNEFLAFNDYEKKEYSRKRFKKGLEVGAENMGFVLVTEKNRQDNNLLHVKMDKM